MGRIHRPLTLGEHGAKSPVVEDEQLDASEALEKARMLTVAACERQCIEEPWQTPIDDRSVIAASLVAERTGNPTFADTGRADDQQVLASFDPLAGDELLEQRLVEAARCLRVDVLDDSVLSQLCEAQAVHQPLVLALGRFAIDEQREPLLEGKRGDVGLSLLFVECARHAGQSERDEAAQCGMGQHRLSFPQW